MTLEFIWYLVIVLALICYAMLDGFDLGVGLLHLFTKKDVERRIFLNSIGPIWDGNEVWLVIVAGALFAGFPEVFATIFSTFYLPVMVWLTGLIFRAVSIEFRSKHNSKRWRTNWDILFAAGSFVIAFGIGVFLGNLIHGFALDENHNFIGSFKDFIHPYNLIVGLMTVALFSMHGSIFLVMKTSGELHDKIRSWVPRTIAFFVATYLLVSILTLFQQPHMINHMVRYPILFLLPRIDFGIYLFRSRSHEKSSRWMGFSVLLQQYCLSPLFSCNRHLPLYGPLHPFILKQIVLFIANSASSPLTLKILLIIVAIGIPMVLGYGFYVYRVFRGKVEIDESSY